jgi:hypothetical protein
LSKNYSSEIENSQNRHLSEPVLEDSFQNVLVQRALARDAHEELGKLPGRPGARLGVPDGLERRGAVAGGARTEPSTTGCGAFGGGNQINDVQVFELQKDFKILFSMIPWRRALVKSSPLAEVGAWVARSNPTRDKFFKETKTFFKLDFFVHSIPYLVFINSRRYFKRFLTIF